MAEISVERIVDALAANESPLRDEGISLAVEFVLSSKITSLIDLPRSRDIVIRALTEDNLRRIFVRHIKPGWRRYSSSATGSKDLIGTLVPDDARRGIRDAVTSSRLPKGNWMQGAVEPALLKKLLAPVFTTVLVTFAKRLPLPGGPATLGASQAVGREVSSIAGRLGRKVQQRAERFVDAGRTVMGGLGAEMEKRFQSAAREFSEGALTTWRDTLRERLRSEEGRELVRQMSQQATDHVMMAPIAEVHVDFQRLAVDAVLDLAPSVIAHATRTIFVERIVEAEIRAFLEAEGERSVAEVLSELGVLDEVKSELQTRFGEMAKEFVKTEAVRDWLSRVLQA